MYFLDVPVCDTRKTVLISTIIEKHIAHKILLYWCVAKFPNNLMSCRKRKNTVKKKKFRKNLNHHAQIHNSIHVEIDISQTQNNVNIITTVYRQSLIIQPPFKYSYNF